MVKTSYHCLLTAMKVFGGYKTVTDEDLHGRNVLPLSSYHYVKAQ